MGLVRPDEPVRIVPLTGGVSSLIARVETPSSVFCVKQARPKLQVAADWTAPVERNHAEVAWFKRCAAIAPDAVPRLLAEDPGRYAFAMEYFDPAAFTVWKEALLDDRVDPDVAAAVGATLAAVHAATADDAEVAAAFPNDDAFEALRLDPYFGEAARRHPDVAPVLHALTERTRRTRRALVHGDVSPKNILVGEGRVVLLDAECATYGDPAFDVAFCLNHLLLKSVHRPASAAAYLKSFRVLARTYFDGVTWEPVEALEARVSSLLPALLLARVDGKSPVEYLVGDDDARRLVRNTARCRLADLPTRLDSFDSFGSLAA